MASLAAPIRAVQASLGTSSPELPTAALSGISNTLAGVSAEAGGSWQRTQWTGDASEAAADFTMATVAAIDALANRTEGLGTAAAGAADAVARARSRLRAIVEEFEARAASLEARIDEPGTADELIAESHRALDEARRVVDELRAELDVHRAAVDESAPAAMPTTPMGAMPSLGGDSGSGTGGGPGLGAGGGMSDAAGFARSADSSSGLRGDAVPETDPGMFGSGVAIALPDGSSATAPNEVAADAVRHALTQLGVPYDWGGTTPGVGLDCSGLTQWAYHEAGLDLPRLAQEQDVGSAVTQASLRPGDLAVWDGHVAMIVGNGTMIEAGDPVHLSPIRTTNAGQGFQGFWRPTA